MFSGLWLPEVGVRRSRSDGYRERAHPGSELLYLTERGAGPALLLVHGLMVTGEMFEPVLEHLASRHRVIVPDLRGHGRSGSLPPPYSVAQLASDLSRLLDHLGIDSAAVLGYSQGGAVAQQLVLDPLRLPSPSLRESRAQPSITSLGSRNVGQPRGI